MLTIDKININNALVDTLSQMDNNYPHRKEDFYKALHPYVLDQWIWASEELMRHFIFPEKMNCENANVFASGYCFYPGHFWKKWGLKNVFLYDLDPEIKPVNWSCLEYIRDCVNIDQKSLDVLIDDQFVSRDNIDMVINMSCESMYDMKHIIKKGTYPKNTIFVFQGTDKIQRGNINIHKTIEEFEQSTSFGEDDILFSGERDVNFGNYKGSGAHKRFMVIARYNYEKQDNLQ